jgi:uncharacterized repeat protein (TIGR02543 family)
MTVISEGQGQPSQPAGGVLTVKGVKNGTHHEAAVYDYPDDDVEDAADLKDLMSRFELVAVGLGTAGNKTLALGLVTLDGENFTADGDFLVVLKQVTKDDSAPFKYKGAVPFSGGNATVEYNKMETATRIYTVTFDLNYTDAPSPPKPQEIDADGKVTPPAVPVRTGGYTFGGWYTDAAGTGAAWDFGTDTVTTDIDLYAKWTRNTYKVTFYTGDAEPTPAPLENVLYDDKITAPVITKTGHTLDGWYKEADKTTKWNFALNTVKESITLYGEWIPASAYGISLNQSGTWTFPAATAGYGAQTAKSVTITNTGNQPTGSLTLALSSSSAFTLSATSMGSITAGGSNSFTVTPKTGLSAGTYTATVTVSGGNGISASFNVSFTVNEPSAQEDGWTSLAPALAYLSAHSGGSTAANPVPLKLNVNLASSTDGWYALVVAIRDSDKYVALDISGSTVINGEFDPGINDAEAVQAKIVSLILPDSATSIIGGSYSLSSSVYAKLKTVSGANITTIGMLAFYNCSSLTTASFPEAITIGTGVQTFSGCYALTTASFAKATSIGDYAFSSCMSLTSESFAKATSIGERAFIYCTSLTSVSFPEATSIGQSDFQGTALSNVSFPEATTIGVGAFYQCAALTTAFIPKATSIGQQALSGCTALTTVSFPKVTSIGNYAFSSCPSLTTASFPKATYIGKGAFINSGRGLLTITMRTAAPTVGNNMFDSINGSRTVTIMLPSRATGYTSTWQTAFKGYGTNTPHGTVNSYINLVFEYY